MQQFEVYISALGWTPDGFMPASGEISLLKPDDVNSVDMINPSIKLTLQNIAGFTVTVRRRKLYLANSTTLDELYDYHTSNRATRQSRYDAATLNPGHTSSSEEDHGVPAFTVPKFLDDSLEEK